MSFFFKGAHALSPRSRLCDSYKFLLWKASPEVRCCNEHSGKQITHFEQVPRIFVRTMQRRATVANYGYRLLVMTEVNARFFAVSFVSQFMFTLNFCRLLQRKISERRIYSAEEILCELSNKRPDFDFLDSLFQRKNVGKRTGMRDRRRKKRIRPILVAFYDKPWWLKPYSIPGDFTVAGG